MKTTKAYFSILILLIFFSTNSYSQVIKDTRPPKEKLSLITTQGKVTEINKETRKVTLMGPQGELVSVTASDAVERFDEIAVGDVVTFEYYTYMKAEFREPTAEELEEPLVVLVEGGRAPDSMGAAGIVGAEVKAVVSIEVLNRPYMQVTVKGPRGNYTTLPMEDAELITQLHIGQVVILTYTEAMVVSLEKVD
ncbi:MAG: hypothetical protein QNK20_08295 [Aureibaculum sp.]|nr:hypothetical protein [Aureibaculum sp.]